MRRQLFACLLGICVAQVAFAEDELRDYQDYAAINGTALAGAYPVVVPPAASGIREGETFTRSGGRAFIRTRLRTPGAAAAVNPPDTRLDVQEPITILGRTGASAVDVILIAGAVGDITRNAGGTTTATFTAQLEQQTAAGAWANVPTMNLTFTLGAGGALTTSDFRLRNIDTRAHANARNFRLTLTSRLVCRTAAGQAGNVNDVDFYTTTSPDPTTWRDRGFWATIAVSPSGFGDSRAAINVDQARSNAKLRLSGGNFVEGRNVRVGQIELGVPMTTHVDLPVAALTIDPQSTNAFWRGEHANVVAGIIAGRSGTAAQRGVAPSCSLYASAFSSYTEASEDANILRSINWLFDVNPVADIGTASFGVQNYTDVATPDSGTPKALLFDWLVDKRGKLFCVSAGNYGVSGARPEPGEVGSGQSTTLINREQSISGGNGGYNVLTVGALDWNFGARAYFSSFGPTRNQGGGRTKPDIMAPGLMTLSMTGVNLNGDANLNDYSRAFLGAFDTTLPENMRNSTGAHNNGTSFAAPHAAGALALILEYVRDFNAAAHGDASDPRVIKSAVINTGFRGVKRREGTDWTQGFSNPTTIVTPLDQQLGGGLLKVDQAMLQLRPREISLSETLPAPNNSIRIDVPDSTSWDKQIIGKSSTNRSTLNYYFKKAWVKGQTMRACMTWHRQVSEADNDNTIEATDTYSYTNNDLTNLNLKLFAWNSQTKDWDIKLRSSSPVDNVEAFHDYEVDRSDEHVIQLKNGTDRDEKYGFSVLFTGNPAAAGGRLLASARPLPGAVTSTRINARLPVELASNVHMKASFDCAQLLSQSDDVFVLDDNDDFSYQPGFSYPIYFGPELRDVPSDPNSDTNWFQTPSINLLSLSGWRMVPSTPAASDGTLPATLISDALFRSQLTCASNSPSEFNFVIDVDGDGFFSPDDDGIGWFVVRNAPGLCPINGCDSGGKDADFDDDCDVDLNDLSMLLANFGSDEATVGDTDGDADVDLSDLSTMLSRFGATCH